MLNQVIDLLEGLCGVYGQLYVLSEQKQEKIITNDADAVNDIVKEEWILLSQATDLEKERGDRVGECLAANGKSELEATMQNLLEIASTEQKGRLQEVSSELKGLLEQQKQINAENRSLIELHLEYMDYMVNTVYKEPQVSSIYGNSGMVADVSAVNRGFIDNEA